jgi:hypothetical protein
MPDNIPFLTPEQIDRKIAQIRGRLAVKDDVLHSATGSALALFREGFAADERELARLLALADKGN